MKIELPEIRPEDRTPLVEALLGLTRQLADRVAELEEANRELRDEIAVLKGQKPRPKISPSILTRVLHIPWYIQRNARADFGPFYWQPFPSFSARHDPA